MSKNLDNQSPHYEEMKVNAGAARVAGDLLTEGVTNVFPMVDVESGADFAGVYKSAKVKAAKATGALAAGAAAYWVNATKNVAGAGDILIGHVNEAALSGDTHVNIDFDGTLAFAKA